MYERQSEYTQYQTRKVLTGTFNVNSKKPYSVTEAAKLAFWLDSHLEEAKKPDIIALGFQEIVDLNAVNVVVNNMTATRSVQWEESILAVLNTQLSSNEYEVVMGKHLVGILLLVFVRKEHSLHVAEVKGATAGVGIMGMMGNKGGAAIRLKFYDSTICFVCSHLAAHTQNVAGRNADFANILAKIVFQDNIDELNPNLGYSDNSAVILNHDFVFWIGDLNYRITDDLTVEECFMHVEKKNYDALLKRDQLIIEKNCGNVFQGFEEGAIKFPPTYKFQAGTSLYERRPEKKLRAPAWCDRVLWKVKNASHVRQIHYGATMEIELSDHKPVKANFQIKVKYELEDKKEQIHRDIYRELDKWESDNTPKIEIDNSVLSFPKVQYMVPQTLPIWIENTGLVVAHFRFLPKQDDVRIAKSWLSINPPYGMIPPKERLEIKITAFVDNQTAHALTSGSDTLDDTLILRVENGGDRFVAVSGHYDNSCFGCSSKQLVVLTDPVRKGYVIPAGRAKDTSRLVPKIPKELWRMVDDLYTQHIDVRGLFLESGIHNEIRDIREALDTGEPFAKHSPHSMAEALLCWLQSLRESVIPDNLLVNNDVDSLRVVINARAVVDGLHAVHYNTFVYLISFLREVVKHNETNKATPQKLAYAFSRCLISQRTSNPNDPTRRQMDEADMKSKGAAMEKLLLHFITTTTL